MNTSVEGIIVNNCQYAPIYLIQDPGSTQANTYVLASSVVDQPKPISNNLKTFYENSGNIENGLVNVDASARPSLPKKKEGVLIGNNLKLASFLLPKTENVNKQYVVDNIVLKPNVTTTTGSSVQVNTVPKIDIDRKIVKLKDVPIINRTRPEKVLPKIKPKENIPSLNQSNHTSVQLIKLGETYHSLNHLSKEQVKMVNQALKMFKDPDKTKSEPTYDPVTNTRYIYKVVSPKDLTVVGQKKILVKEKKLTKIPKRVIEEKLKLMKQMMPVKEVVEEPPEPEPPVETKVTRSGRKVKLPRQILPEDSPHKSKKKTGTIISCFQCTAEFGSLYRLQKHYENHPTHIPAKIHSNLFHCLLAIIKSGSEGDKTNIFIQQLEQLIVKLKSLLPCLLKKVDGSEGKPCTINDDVGRLFGMNPGKYNIDVEALNCVKDKNGYCIHNPPKLNKYIKDHKPSALSMHNEDIPSPESETENCARINSVAKWPTVSKRIWKLKPKTHELSAKKMRLKSEGDTLIDLGTDDFIFNAEEDTTSTLAMVPENDINNLLENSKECKINCTSGNVSDRNNIEVTATNNIVITNQSKQKSSYIPFHSAHFDIRSSPIKPSTSTGFVKFQINSSKISKVSKNYQGQVIRALEMNDKDDGKHSQTMLNSENNLHVPMCPSTRESSHIPMSSSSGNLHVPMSSSNNHLHVSLPNLVNELHIGLQNTNNSLHVPLSNSDNGQHANLGNSDTSLNVTLPSPNDALHVPLPDSDNLQLPIPNSVDNLHVPMPTTDSSLHDIFTDDVDLSCKDDSNIDPVLKEWIISTSVKSENNLESFTKSSSLIEPAFLHGTNSVDKSMIKNETHNCDIPSLDVSDGRLLASQGESVLNFLETLGNDLVYPETEIRNNGVDFQLDLFTFDNS
ncbi:unnamed protein product [Arctia plantaginis]|uniref:C2H2-type domain-containing protein n=1 Tax=Arctia plantaginis TaxID=874455 RepID=A0A8S0ZAK9_ARCPL|nr:unnamed protein product [Arctia plantaginis]